MKRSALTIIAVSVLAGLAALTGCTSLPPARSARSLQPGKAQGNLILEAVDAHYTKDVSGSGADHNEDAYKDVAAISGEFRGGTQVPGLEIGLGAGSLSSLYMDIKEQFLGKPWREGFAASLDAQVDYFPFSNYDQNNTEFNSGFGGSAGLTLGQFIGFADLNVGGRFGTLPPGTLYAYYTLFDLPGNNAPSSNYYEVNASLNFNVARSVGMDLGAAYRTYLTQTGTFGKDTDSEQVKLTLPGFFMASLTLHFGGQIPLTEAEETAPAPKTRRERRAEAAAASAVADDNSAALLQAAKRLMAAKDYEGAIQTLKNAQAAGGESQKSDMQLGYCYYQLKNWAQSLSYYRKAQLYAPDDEKLQKAVAKLEKKVPSAEDSEAPLPAD